MILIDRDTHYISLIIDEKKLIKYACMFDTFIYIERNFVFCDITSLMYSSVSIVI